MKYTTMLFIFSVVISYTQMAYANPVCEGIQNNFAATQKEILEPLITKQLSKQLKMVRNVDILQSFQSGRWSIIYVNTYVSDEMFLFYANDPLVSDYVTIWSGAAGIEETQEIKEWVLKNAPGVPEDLANCFSWHVTNGRTK